MNNLASREQSQEQLKNELQKAYQAVEKKDQTIFDVKLRHEQSSKEETLRQKRKLRKAVIVSVALTATLTSCDQLSTLNPLNYAPEISDFTRNKARADVLTVVKTKDQNFPINDYTKCLLDVTTDNYHTAVRFHKIKDLFKFNAHPTKKSNDHLTNFYSSNSIENLDKCSYLNINYQEAKQNQEARLLISQVFLRSTHDNKGNYTLSLVNFDPYKIANIPLTTFMNNVFLASKEKPKISYLSETINGVAIVRSYSTQAANYTQYYYSEKDLRMKVAAMNEFAR